MRQATENAIAKGARYLAAAQTKRGSWLGGVGRRKDLEDAEPSPNVFTTALVLGALAPLAGQERVKKKALRFLFSEMSRRTSWNYWERATREAKARPYPDDLDDTTLALAAILKCNPRLVSGAMMAEAVKVLTALDAGTGGPYRTWLVNANAKPVWRDVDLAVNANVAYFLHLQDVHVPGLTGFMEKRIAAGSFISPYYASAYPVLYFIARAYAGPLRRELLRHARKLHPQNDLEKALLLSALVELGASREVRASLAEALLASRNADGSWPARAFSVDLKLKGETFYGGAAVLTTAFAIEALQKHLREPSRVPAAMDARAKTFRKNVWSGITKLGKRFPDEFGKAWSALAARLEAQDKNGKISLLPHLFLEHLPASRKKRVPLDAVSKLAAANIYGWMAYTVYDDAMDGDLDPDELSPANAAHRELVRSLAALFEVNSREGRFAERLLDRVDAANAWEMAHCRIEAKDGLLRMPDRPPDFAEVRTLADRSIGHALAPIGVLFLAGYGPDSEEVKTTLTFFESYIAARQLNDDAHDWFEDLSRGRVNAASAGMLRRRKKSVLNVEKEKEALERIFWEKEIPLVGRKILRYASRARKALSAIPLDNKSFLEAMLLPLETSAKDAVRESREALDFLKAY
jgi:hypothetical protein